MGGRQKRRRKKKRKRDDEFYGEARYIGEGGMGDDEASHRGTWDPFVHFVRLSFITFFLFILI